MSDFAIIVPYRDRQQHRVMFTKHMKQRFPDAPIYFIEQADKQPFNRAKLLNVGVLETDFSYYALHDVDMLPQKADYSFPENPVHLATKVQQFRYRMPYPTYFGGVVLFSKDDFIKVDGFSNEFWGWGSEDDEMYNNVINHGLQVTRREGQYISLHHRSADRSHHAINILRNLAGRKEDDGLHCCRYKLLSVEESEYITIKVDLKI